MRVITKGALRTFWQRHPDAEEALQAWFEEAERAVWRNPADIRSRYANASILAGNRAVFNIKGNHYRLVVQIHYNTQIVYVRFVGPTLSMTESMRRRFSCGIQDTGYRIPDTVGLAGDLRARIEAGRGANYMEIKPIRTNEDYAAALAEIETLLDAQPGTPAEDRLDVLATLVQSYEAAHHAIPKPNPIAALEYYLESRGLTRKALEPYIGPPHRVTEVMNRRRRLTLAMIRRLEAGTGIPATVLIQTYELTPAARAATPS